MSHLHFPSPPSLPPFPIDLWVWECVQRDSWSWEVSHYHHIPGGRLCSAGHRHTHMPAHERRTHTGADLWYVLDFIRVDSQLSFGRELPSMALYFVFTEQVLSTMPPTVGKGTFTRYRAWFAASIVICWYWALGVTGLLWWPCFSPGNCDIHLYFLYRINWLWSVP